MPPFVKLRRQVAYLQSLPVQAKKLFPEVRNVAARTILLPPGTPEAKKFHGRYREFMYDMEFVHGLELSEFIRQHKPPPGIVAKIYREISVFLEPNTCQPDKGPRDAYTGSLIFQKN